MMKRLALVVFTGVLLIATGLVASDLAPENYRASKITLGVGFVAKELCSCRFVVGRDEASCREFARVDGLDPWINVNESAREVEAVAFIFWRKKARFVDDRIGCRVI